jgi:regulator of nonsense transcripts 2
MWEKRVVRKVERGEDDEGPEEDDWDDGESSSLTSHVSAFLLTYRTLSPPIPRSPTRSLPRTRSRPLLLQESLGPSEEADAELTKELIKTMTDTSSESRKVDKKTALAMWESTTLRPAVMLKWKNAGAGEETGEDGIENGNVVGNVGGGVGQVEGGEEIMRFTVVTRGISLRFVIMFSPIFFNFSIFFQTRQMAVPTSPALAVPTCSTQMQDNVEQQHLKRLVLDYEQREEVEEMKGK